MYERNPKDETWICPPPGRGGRLRVAVAYPNTYWVGMSNLGFQAVLRAFLEKPGFDVKRVFWDGSGLQFPDGGRALNEFDVVAFSVSYQPDIVHLPRMLEAGRAAVPAPRRSRPLLVGGGVTLTLNPEPAAPLLDVIAIGESEPFLESLTELLQSNSRGGGSEDLTHQLASLPGAYIPSLYTTEESEDGLMLPHPVGSVGATVRRVFLKNLDDHPARPAVVTRGTEFGTMYPLEISRGCPAGCAFCAAAAVCSPVRFLRKERFIEEVEIGLRYRKKIGLVGTAVSYHPDLFDFGAEIHKRGGSFSPSSIRLERLNPELAGLLAQSRHKTVSIAPESASERLRASIGKGVADSSIINAVDILQDAGLPNLKLYFMVGLPGEEDSDALGIIDLVDRVRSRMIKHGRKKGRMGSISVSINPFVPKPHTALERSPMAEETVLSGRIGKVRDGLKRLGGVKVQAGSVRAAYLDGLISLGDRRITGFLGDIPRSGLSMKRLDKLIPSASQILLSERSGKLPWHFIEN
ncbi:MAG: radical SAM protein [bacterium]